MTLISLKSMQGLSANREEKQGQVRPLRRLEETYNYFGGKFSREWVRYGSRNC